MVEEGPEGESWPTVPQQEASWVIRIFASSRYFAAFAVFGSFLAAVTLYVYGTLVVIQTIWDTIVAFEVNVEGAQRLEVSFIELTDVFLLGTVLFIVAFGLYQLFIQPDLPVPPWLKIQNIDQLSERLIEVVGVLLSVTFLAFAVETILDHPEQVSILELGITVAIVIATLSLLLFVSRRWRGGHGSSPGE